MFTTVVGEGHIELAPSSGCGVAMSEDKCEGKAKYIEVCVIRGKQVFVKSWHLAMQRHVEWIAQVGPWHGLSSSGWLRCSMRVIHSRISEAVDTCSSGLPVLHEQQQDTPGPKSPVCFPS